LGTTTRPDHASIGTSGLDASRTANRYWTLTPTGSPTLTNYDATLGFGAADVDVGATPTLFSARRFSSGAWTSLVTGTRTATSTQVTGVTGYGDFAVGEQPQYTLNVTTVGPGSVTKVPDQAF